MLARSLKKIAAMLLCGLALMAATATPAQAQMFGRWRTVCPPSPCPPEAQPVAPAPIDQTAPSIPPAALAQAPSATPEFASPLGGELFAANMVGDFLSPSGGLRQIAVVVPGRLICTTTPGQVVTTCPVAGQPPVTTTTPSTTVCIQGPPQVEFRSFSVPSGSHGFKISENQNVLPDCRVFFNYNYFNNVNDALNTRIGADVGQMDVHHEVFGFEKTFLEGKVSILMSLPINTLDADTAHTQGLGGTFTDVGDLTIAAKALLLYERELGLALSAGLAVTVPTGPSGFAGADVVGTFHSTLLQPYVGYLWQRDALYFHGFTSLDVPTESHDVTLLFNDLGVGYFVYRNHGGNRLVTDLASTFEIHINTPLNHRGSLHGPVGTPDWVDLVGAVSVVVEGGSSLAIGFGAPITGPKPYDLEALVELNIRF